MAVETLEAPPASAPVKQQILQTALLIAFTVAVDTFVSALSAEKLNFLYKNELGLVASSFAVLGIVLNIPQYLRPFIGTLTDLVPLAGYHRRSYFALAVVAESCALLALSFLKHYSYAVVAVLVVTQAFGVVLMFLMMEATLVRVGNATGTIGRFQTVQQVVRYALITSCTAHLSGFVTQHWSYHTCFRAAALMTILALPLTLLIEERPVSHGRQAHETPEEHEVRAEEKRQDRKRVFAALRAGASSPGLWIVVGFIFYLILTPGTSTAQFYYQVDHLKFSKQLLGDLTAYGAAGSVIGFLTFAAISPKLPTRFLPIGLVILDCVGYVLNFALRDPKSAMIIAVVGGVIYGWYYLGTLTMGARACPPGIEGTVYGLVYAAQFLGSTLSDVIGSKVYDHFGGASHHLYAGWIAVTWAGIGFSALAALFLPFMPAWAKSSSPLKAPVPNAEPIATTGISS